MKYMSDIDDFIYKIDNMCVRDNSLTRMSRNTFSYKSSKSNQKKSNKSKEIVYLDFLKLDDLLTYMS